MGVAESKPFRLDHSLQLWAKDQPVASPEREAFLDHLEEQVQKTAGSEAQLPPDRMGYAFRHAGRDYRIQFWRLYRQQGRRGARAPEVYNTDGYGLLFLGPQPAP